MIRATDIHSLTDFRKNAAAHIRRLKRTNRPEVLTVNGEPGVIVMSPKAYDELAREAEMIGHLEAAKRGHEQIERGEKRDLREFVEGLAREHGVELRKA